MARLRRIEQHWPTTTRRLAVICSAELLLGIAYAIIQVAR